MYTTSVRLNPTEEPQTTRRCAEYTKCQRLRFDLISDHTLGSCGRNPLESENSVKTGLAKPSEISFTKPTQQGRYRISPMAGEPPQEAPVHLTSKRHSRGELTALSGGGGLFDSRYAAWSRSWQLLASTLSSCWLVK